MTKEEIKFRFHEYVPFPEGLGGEEINGVELVLADTDSAGLIDTFIRLKTGLDPVQYDSLLKVRNDLATIIHGLPPHGKAYFQARLDLVEQILLVRTA